MAKDGMDKDTLAGKFSVEAPKKLYNANFVESMLFPFRKPLFDKIPNGGLEFSLPDVAVFGATKAGDAKKPGGQTVLKCGTKMKEISPGDNVLLCNPEMSHSWVVADYLGQGSPASLVLAAKQKAPGKLDLTYSATMEKTPWLFGRVPALDRLFALEKASGTLKLEERKGQAHEIVGGVAYTLKNGTKLDLKGHACGIMGAEKFMNQEALKLKAAAYVPILSTGDTKVHAAGEVKGGAAWKLNLGLAAQMMKGMVIAGVWCRAEGSNTTVGGDVYQKLEVAGKKIEAAYNVSAPMANLGGFTWLAGLQLPLSKQWTLNAKVNGKPQLNLSLKHTRESSFTFQVGTLMRLDDPLAGGFPRLGFKVTMKA